MPIPIIPLSVLILGIMIAVLQTRHELKKSPWHFKCKICAQVLTSQPEETNGICNKCEEEVAREV